MSSQSEKVVENTDKKVLIPRVSFRCSPLMFSGSLTKCVPFQIEAVDNEKNGQMCHVLLH